MRPGTLVFEQDPIHHCAYCCLQPSWCRCGQVTFPKRTALTPKRIHSSHFQSCSFASRLYRPPVLDALTLCSVCLAFNPIPSHPGMSISIPHVCHLFNTSPIVPCLAAFKMLFVTTGLHPVKLPLPGRGAVCDTETKLALLSL